MKKKKNITLKSIENRRASFDYQLNASLTAGMSLKGVEVRAIRDNRVSLKGAFITIRNNELWLNNASLSLKNTGEGKSETTIDTSPKKLLVNRKELDKLALEKQAGMTIVPIRILSGERYIKIVIASGKGKKKFDKREALKQKQSNRENAKLLKNYR